MQNNKNSKIYVGLDVGTDSVGYAVTDNKYNLLKYKGEPMWGSHLFEEANLNDERRLFRCARRRLNRRQQRVKLLQGLFAKEIAKVDKNFFIRIKESALYPEDTTHGAYLFDDKDFKDSNYNTIYPTIHHLIVDLIKNEEPHDVRLVYIACAWLVAHRGHFLNEISKENIENVLDINAVYNDFMEFFEDEKPWDSIDVERFGEILKQKISVSRKYKELSMFIYGMPKAPKDMETESGFLYNREAMLKMLCGSKVAPKQLFCNEEYADIESFTLDRADDELLSILTSLNDEDSELIIKLKALFDWAVLSNVCQDEYISISKINVYEQHEKDLKALKYLFNKYMSSNYDAMFRDNKNKKINYSEYAKGDSKKQEDFCKYVKSLLKNVYVEAEDEEIYKEIIQRADDAMLCPKQVNSNNRVIPYQVYWVELKAILDNAVTYLPFLNETEDGVTVAEKILKIFEFRVPYFVGPLNKLSENSWFIRKTEGKIYPWNFEDKVDLEASEQAFIDRMTNTCTYLPNEDVLPKMSLCYQKFQLLNEINPIEINGRRIPVEVKQRIYTELCMVKKRVTKKSIKDFLKSNNLYSDEEVKTLSGIDDNIKSSLSSYMAFRNLLESGKLTEKDAERIIERRTYTESKCRFTLWLYREYPNLSEKDKKYIGTLKFNDFGRLSRKLLSEFYGTEADTETGEAKTILDRMWKENLNLMEILSDKYTYYSQIEEIRSDYFGSKDKSIDKRLDEMYISNSVKRPIIRTLDILSDVVKVNGKVPDKIFVEMSRGRRANEKAERKLSRYSQIIELYSKCKDEDVKELTEQLNSMGDEVNTRLQSDKLFLYYMQFGKSMYSNTAISLSDLMMPSGSKKYDIDHIYPQSKVKDDSILNNKVLVTAEENANKGDRYPIASNVREKMHAHWKSLREKNAITEEKYKRLIRNIPFTDDERWGFINRQLVETRQSTKALATVLSEIYPETEIVYVKAGLVSDFRKEFDMLKSRAVNDLHHAKDAYLNIVVGNVYNEVFTKRWFLKNEISLKTDTIFKYSRQNSKGKTVWQGKEDIEKIKHIVHNKNAIHLTRYSFCRKGGLFDQMPLSASTGLVELKKGLPTEKYGGYNKTTASFFMLVKYNTDKKSDLRVMPIELLYADKVLNDYDYAVEYAKETIESMINKNVLSVEFPLGMRKLKIGTIFEFDNCWRAYLTKKGSGGKVIGLALFNPLIVGYDWEKYIKRLEVFTEKKKNNPNLIYSEVYDKINTTKNIELYDILTEKLKTAAYNKIPANPVNILINGRELFINSDIFEQSKCLMQILIVFSRTSGCDLKLIDGAPKSAVTSLSSDLSNWEKYYSDVKIIDTTASGLFKSKSVNLLELL